MLAVTITSPILGGIIKATNLSATYCVAYVVMSVIVIDAKSIANCALPSTNAGIPATCPAIAPALPIAVPTTCPAPTARESAITSGAYFNASASALALPNILDNDVAFLNCK